jgi:hypothetical protein
VKKILSIIITIILLVTVAFAVDTSGANAPEVYEIEVRLEECEETEDLIECIDVKDEFGVTNPSFKEEAK